MRSVPSVAEVERITAVEDPVIRNLQITQCYHDLSAALATRLDLCANWCTFATWASKQAGQTIRRKDLAAALENALNTTPVTAHAMQKVVTAVRHVGAKHETEKIRAAAWDALGPSSPVNRASDAVARGNKKVFEEVGREFARFFATCLQDTAFDSAKIASFIEELTPGDPPGGQEYLRRAFARYYTAFFEADLKVRAELLLLANIEIGFHEQTRLQPEIAESLDALVPDSGEFKNRLLDNLFPERGLINRLRGFFRRLFGGKTPLDEEAEALVAAARQQAHLVVTEHLLTLTLPQGVRLKLGEDLNAEFPATLREIVNADLNAFLTRFDPTPNSLRGSGAVDWADLPERLHYIMDLFRCFQERADLFDPPFAAAQVAEFTAGRLPSGHL